MSSDDRIKRPEPDRTEPIRTWDGKQPPPRSRDGGPAGGGIGAAVDLGYRVVDEYIRQGQRVAERMGIGAGRTAAATGDIQELATRMAQYTSDFLGVWAQFVEVAFGSSGQALRSPGPRSTPGGAASGDGAPPPGGGRGVAVAIESSRPTEVVIDLSPDMLGRNLTIPALRSTDRLHPTLTGATFHPARVDAPARVVLAVPPSLPAGAYHGVVVDEETGRFAGTVRVRVADFAPS